MYNAFERKQIFFNSVKATILCWRFKHMIIMTEMTFDRNVCGFRVRRTLNISTMKNKFDLTHRWHSQFNKIFLKNVPSGITQSLFHKNEQIACDAIFFYYFTLMFSFLSDDSSRSCIFCIHYWWIQWAYRNRNLNFFQPSDVVMNEWRCVLYRIYIPYRFGWKSIAFY